jgi:hypothetical protein
VLFASVVVSLANNCCSSVVAEVSGSGMLLVPTSEIVDGVMAALFISNNGHSCVLDALLVFTKY